MMEQRRTQARPIIIRIIKAQDLPTADWDNNLADPYVAITVLKVRPYIFQSGHLLGGACMGYMLSMVWPYGWGCHTVTAACLSITVS
jgi:hypothetical protein